MASYHFAHHLMLHNDVLKYVLFRELAPCDLCACALVCVQWRDAAMHVARTQYSKYMLQHYACKGMYDAYTAILAPDPAAIHLAIIYGRDAFVSACVRDGFIKTLTLDNRSSVDAMDLRDYLTLCIQMSRDGMFTMLYLCGGWYFPNLLVDAARFGNLYMCKQMYWKDHRWLISATAVAYSNNKWHVYRYLCPRGDIVGHYSPYKTQCYGEDEDVDVPGVYDDCDVMELFA